MPSTKIAGLGPVKANASHFELMGIFTVQFEEIILCLDFLAADSSLFMCSVSLPLLTMVIMST